MNKKTRQAVLVGAILLLAPFIQGHAANRAGMATFSAMYSHYFFDDSRHLRNVNMPLFSFGYDFSQHFGIEGIFSFIWSKTTTALRRKVRGNFYTVSGLYYFKPHYHLQPYLVLGVGALKLKPNGIVTPLNPNGDAANTQMNFNWGGGLEYFVTRHIAIRAEGRGVYQVVRSRFDGMLNIGLSFFLQVPHFSGSSNHSAKA